VFLSHQSTAAQPRRTNGPRMRLPIHHIITSSSRPSSPPPCGARLEVWHELSAMKGRSVHSPAPPRDASTAFLACCPVSACHDAAANKKRSTVRCPLLYSCTCTCTHASRAQSGNRPEALRRSHSTPLRCTRRVHGATTDRPTTVAFLENAHAVLFVLRNWTVCMVRRHPRFTAVHISLTCRTCRLKLERGPPPRESPVRTPRSTSR
jgi:hypothetical protein